MTLQTTALNTKSFFWIIPFLCFLTAYWLTIYFFGGNSINTPALIGLDIATACYQLSENNLNLRVIGQKEDPDLPPNIIIQQTPGPGQKIKPNKSIFCHITKQPEPNIAPNLINKPIAQLPQSNNGDSRVVTYCVPGTCDGICVGQIPSPNCVLHDNKVIALVAKSNASIALFPNLLGQPAANAQEWFKEMGYKTEIFHKYPVEMQNHTCNCIIMAQKPIAGTVVDLAKPLTIQLIVS
jgi:beta-lactam-binding protein with PASTA domain